MFANRKWINAKKFEQWKIDALEKINIEDVKNNNNLYSIVKAFLSSYKIKIRNCYKTAADCSLMCHGVRFVLGYTVSSFGIVAAHSWNKFEEVYFDLMTPVEDAHHRVIAYYKILETSAEELIVFLQGEILLEDWTFFEYYYKKFIARDEDYVDEPVDRCGLSVVQEIKNRKCEISSI